ncbi:hypothetical protein BGZ76_009558 [Entomortierella beljakovae]|nr:hypothetical protein BGZ76_009558 [Entomortierella beljakovae]
MTREESPNTADEPLDDDDIPEKAANQGSGNAQFKIGNMNQKWIWYSIPQDLLKRSGVKEQLIQEIKRL